MATIPNRKSNLAPVRYSALLQLRVQPALPRDIDEAAAKQFTTPSEYVRRSLFDRLKADGIDPASFAGAA